MANTVSISIIGDDEGTRLQGLRCCILGGAWAGLLINIRQFQLHNSLDKLDLIYGASRWRSARRRPRGVVSAHDRMTFAVLDFWGGHSSSSSRDQGIFPAVKHVCSKVWLSPPPAEALGPSILCRRAMCSERVATASADTYEERVDDDTPPRLAPARSRNRAARYHNRLGVDLFFFSFSFSCLQPSRVKRGVGCVTRNVAAGSRKSPA